METVKIACKLPHGLQIEVGYKLENNGVIYGDKYRKIMLNGCNSNLIAGAPAVLNAAPGITENVPKDVWEEWMKTAGKRHPAVLNNLIYVVRPDKDSAEAQALAAQSLKSGLEPLDPSKMPKGVTEAPVNGRAA